MPAVLFVDDEQLILKSIERSLHEESYERYFASSGEEALLILEKRLIDVLVTDMRMPGMKGLDLLKTAKKFYPNMVRIVLSGYTQINQMIVTINQGDIFRFIPKPWDVETELKPTILDAIEYSHFLVSKQTDQESLELRNQLYQNVLTRFEHKKVRLNTNIESLKLVQNNTIEVLESVFAKCSEHLDKTLITRVTRAIKIQELVQSLMPLQYSKTDYDLVVSSIKDKIEPFHFPIKVTYNNHITRTPRVYGPIELAPCIIAWGLESILEWNTIESIHVEVTGNLDERINNPDLPPLHISILMDIHLEKDEKNEDLLNQFSLMSSVVNPYIDMRFAIKHNRFVLQMKMDVERSL